MIGRLLNQGQRWLAAGGLAAVLALPAAAAPLDLHEHWHQRCTACHGHAGDFARRWLRVEAGQLQGHHHRDDLPTFLRQHYVADELVQPMLQMLAAQAGEPETFKTRCARCHGTAAEFARTALTLQGGVLHGRASGRPVAAYLATHGGLAADEVPTLVRTLERVQREVTPAPR